jgi:hypothetical protein
MLVGTEIARMIISIIEKSSAAIAAFGNGSGTLDAI